MLTPLGPAVAPRPLPTSTWPPSWGVDPKTLKVGIAWEDGTYGSSVGKGITSLAEKYGFNIVANEGYSAKSTDLSPVILKLKANNPDFLLVAGIGSDAVLFWKQAHDLDLNVKAIVATSGGWGVPNFAKNLGPLANGVFSSDFPTDVNPKSLTQSAAALQKEFLTRYQKLKGTTPTGNGYCAFAGSMLLFQYVLPKAPSLIPRQGEGSGAVPRFTRGEHGQRLRLQVHTVRSAGWRVKLPGFFRGSAMARWQDSGRLAREIRQQGTHNGAVAPLVSPDLTRFDR